MNRKPKLFLAMILFAIVGVAQNSHDNHSVYYSDLKYEDNRKIEDYRTNANYIIELNTDGTIRYKCTVIPIDTTTVVAQYHTQGDSIIIFGENTVHHYRWSYDYYPYHETGIPEFGLYWDETPGYKLIFENDNDLFHHEDTCIILKSGDNLRSINTDNPIIFYPVKMTKEEFNRVKVKDFDIVILPI